MQSVIQIASNQQNLLSQQSEQVSLWKNRCLELESRTKDSSVKDSEYNRLKSIMDSLQQKLTVLVDENSRLNQQLS